MQLEIKRGLALIEIDFREHLAQKLKISTHPAYKIPSIDTKVSRVGILGDARIPFPINCGAGFRGKARCSMKGSIEIINVLNEVLAAELVAINQYFLHAKMCANWGFVGIANKTRTESIGEMKHAEAVVERILFLEGLPNLQRLDKLRIGQTLPEQYKSDLELEYAAVKRLNEGVALCREKGDRTTEALLAKILEDEENHVDWLETQLGLIEKIGEQAYLAEQLRP